MTGNETTLQSLYLEQVATEVSSVSGYGAQLSTAAVQGRLRFLLIPFDYYTLLTYSALIVEAWLSSSTSHNSNNNNQAERRKKEERKKGRCLTDKLFAELLRGVFPVSYVGVEGIKKENPIAPSAPSCGVDLHRPFTWGQAHVTNRATSRTRVRKRPQHDRRSRESYIYYNYCVHGSRLHVIPRP